MGTLASSENPGEMPQNAAFHQGQHCFIKTRTIFIERNTNEP